MNGARPSAEGHLLSHPFAVVSRERITSHIVPEAAFFTPDTPFHLRFYTPLGTGRVGSGFRDG